MVEKQLAHVPVTYMTLFHIKVLNSNQGYKYNVVGWLCYYITAQQHSYHCYYSFVATRADYEKFLSNAASFSTAKLSSRIFMYMYCYYDNRTNAANVIKG